MVRKMPIQNSFPLPFGLPCESVRSCDVPTKRLQSLHRVCKFICNNLQVCKCYKISLQLSHIWAVRILFAYKQN